jgi:hypothetical protein
MKLHSRKEFVGAKTWMLVYADANVEQALKSGPQLDRDRTLKLAPGYLLSSRLRF